MDAFDKFFNSSLKFLSYRPRSEKEVRDNLVKKKAPAEIVETIIDRLKEHKFINDKEFADWFVRSRLGSKPKARRVLIMELKQKGIDPELIEKLNFEDDLESAKKLLEKKFVRYKTLDKDEIYKKLGGFLARRGFDWDTVKKAIDESFGK